jgi:hypothetical protein
MIRSARPFALLPAAWALSAAALAGAAGRAPLSLPEYRAALRQARALAVAALGDQRRSFQQVPAARARIRAALPLQVQVRMSSGVVSVDNRPVVRTLFQALGRRPPEEQRRGLRRFVAALDDLQAATAAPSPAIDRPRADRVLRAVLSRPEYRPPSDEPSWLDRFLLWLQRLLDRWFGRRAPAAPREDGLARLMLAGVVLLLAVLVARIIWLVLPDLRRPRRREAERPGGEVMVPREPAELLAEAEREAAAGRYREALRLTYLAMVTRLDRAGVLPEDRSRTHWELLRDLRRLTRDRETQALGSRLSAVGEGAPAVTDRRQPPADGLLSSLIDLLAPVTRRLDERLYGGRTATAEDYQECRGAHDQIERLLCLPA